MPTRLAIPDLANRSVLKAIWQKSLRKRLRAVRFQEFELGHDPLELIGFERVLGAALDDLCQQLLDGTYRPSAPEWIRSAKRFGLTRSLASLRVRDQLVYKALVALAENDLVRSSPSWARLGRAQVGDDESSTLAESGWFRAWLARDGKLWVMNAGYEWLVESDISNFFPSVQVADVSAFVLENSRLGVGLTRLLEYMLQVFSPVAAYHPSRVGGLPQEGFDVSRVLAHVYLRSLDDEFAFEGENDRYSRWVDDLVIGADTWDEALQIVRRIQMSLEAIGLYPNAAKTRIIRSAAFRLDYMKDENDYLGQVDEAFRIREAVDRSEFGAALRHHLRRADRPKAWGRVLRRYYTNSRRLRDRRLLAEWATHLEESPDSARTIFEYLSTFRITEARFKKLQEVLDQFGGVYEDIEILSHEYLCASPNVGSQSLRRVIGAWSLGLVTKYATANPRIAASACMTLGKFGLPDQIADLERSFHSWRHDTVLRMQAVTVLLAHDRLTTRDLGRLVGRSRLEAIENLEFLIVLSEGDPKAIGMALAGLAPIERHDPKRSVVRTRMLFLAPVVRRADPRRWSRVSTKWQRDLASNSMNLRDFAAERWLFS
jgi:hypothetical protein